MISTNAIITDLLEVPSEWVFQYYLKLPEKLTGQRVMILSPFNPNDKRPSFSIFLTGRNNNIYMFRDFSTGFSGHPVDLVQRLFNLTTKGEAAHKIMADYSNYVASNGQAEREEFKIQTKYRIKEFITRAWNNLDAKYWTQFHIGSKILEHYNVAPIESYTLQREVDGQTEELFMRPRDYIYGYMRADKSLYKIYQPMNQDNKFFKVNSYIQGTDQLTYQKKYLVICSSLKDVMAFTKLNYKEVEAIAPDSENTIIPKHVINAHQLKYKNVAVLFDFDQAGIEAAKKYKELYDINYVNLLLSKDLSDSMRDHGIDRVIKELTPNLKHALYVQNEHNSSKELQKAPD